MSGGEISELTTRLAGLDVAHALGVIVRGDKPVTIVDTAGSLAA